MLFTTVLALLSAAVVRAAPAARSFSRECTDFELRDNWLIANCPVRPGSGEKVQSTVYLSNKITNKEGNMAWAVDGAFSRSCKDCHVFEGILKCSCQSTWDGVKRTQLNLEEHIASYDGILLSDLKGRPSPSKKSPVPVPSDFNYKFQEGDYGCYGADCPKAPDLISGSPGCEGGFSVSGTGPVKCYAFHWPVAGDFWQSFHSARLTSGSKAWEVAVYDNLDCSNKPIRVIKPEDEDKCIVFDTAAVAVSTIPLWTADA